MLRKLVDYKKLDHELAALLIESYPDGYGDDDIITFKNTTGEIIEAVEIKTSHTLYLVKISKSLAHFISNFEENIEKELADKEEALPQIVVSPDYETEFNLEQKSESESEENSDLD